MTPMEDVYTSKQCRWATLQTSRDEDSIVYAAEVLEEAEVNLKGLEQLIEIFSILWIPFSQNIETIYALIQGYSIIVLKPWKASYPYFSGVF